MENTNLFTKEKVTWYALVPAILTAMCLLFPYGYSIGTINSAAAALQNFYEQSYSLRYGEEMSHVKSHVLWAFTASIFPLGGVVGAPLVRPLVAKFGRRNTLVFVQVLSFISTLFIGIAAATNVFEFIILGRAIIGVYCAIVTGVGPMYVSEITTSRIRGVVGGLFSVSIAVGILCANILGLNQIFGNVKRWPILLAINSFPALIYLIYAWWLPKSPRALYLDNRRYDEAKHVLQRLRGTKDVDDELDSLRKQATDAVQIKPMSVKQALTSRGVRWQVTSAIVLMATLQFSGINGIHFYLRDVLMLAGIQENQIVYVSIGVVSFQVFITGIGGLMTKRFGRKTLLLVGNGIIILSMIVFTVATGFIKTSYWFGYVSVAAAVGVIIGFCLGCGPITFTIVPELLDQFTRPAAMTLAVLSLWSSFAIVGFVTPFLFEFLNFLCFLPFLAFTTCATAFIYFIVPETRGQAVLEIQHHFANLFKSKPKNYGNGRRNSTELNVGLMETSDCMKMGKQTQFEKA